MMTKIKVHNPCNEYTKTRFYNYFWDVFTEHLKQFFDVEENRYYEFAHSGWFPVKLEKGISDNFSLLECEYAIENMENGEFVLMSAGDQISAASINEQNNPYLRKVLMSQFLPSHVQYHIVNNVYKYSPWTYFQYDMTNLEKYYNTRQNNKPTENKLYFKGTTPDRPIIFYINKDIITTFDELEINEYFNDLIKYKIALSVDGVGEFCYRDIECFAVGVPIIRFEYSSKMYNELIPNYHYISIPRPDDMTLYRLGNENHAKLLEQRYYEVINDTEFLDFISKNARKYYENNCTMEKLTKNAHNLLNLNNWL